MDEGSRWRAVLIGVLTVLGVTTALLPVPAGTAAATPSGAVEIDDGELNRTATLQSDTGVYTLWGEAAIAAGAAGNLSNIDIAIVDTGIDHTNPELNVTWGIETVGNGTAVGRTAATDRTGHGTAVAAVIGAARNNEGVEGLAPEADLYAVRVFQHGNTTASAADVSEGVMAAARGPDRSLGTSDDADVIVLSLGDPEKEVLSAEAVAVINRSDAVVLAAAGNDGDGDASTDEVDYPAVRPNVIAVGALNEAYDPARYTADGPEVAVAAPGDDVPSYGLNNTAYLWSGTSFAVPHAAVVVAVALDRGVAPGNVSRVLRATARDVGPNGTDEFTGAGLVRADAVATASPPTALDGERPPKDLDNDGLYEDVNSDGTVTVLDVAVLLEQFGTAPDRQIRYFDFNDDNTLNILDVTALLEQV